MPTARAPQRARQKTGRGYKEENNGSSCSNSIYYAQKQFKFFSQTFETFINFARLREICAGPQLAQRVKMSRKPAFSVNRPHPKTRERERRAAEVPGAPNRSKLRPKGRAAVGKSGSSHTGATKRTLPPQKNSPDLRNFAKTMRPQKAAQCAKSAKNACRITHAQCPRTPAAKRLRPAHRNTNARRNNAQEAQSPGAAMPAPTIARRPPRHKIPAPRPSRHAGVATHRNAPKGAPNKI